MGLCLGILYKYYC